MNHGDSENPEMLVYDSIDGVMTCLQILVWCLRDAGQLDADKYACLLADFRLNKTSPDSMQGVIIDRMLSGLVDDPEVLLRRLSMKVLPVDNEAQ
ncbi:hypothetical protein F3U23_17425 [Salmonella enterica]|nr:hypothetical protein [Salmonella enterica]